MATTTAYLTVFSSSNSVSYVRVGIIKQHTHHALFGCIFYRVDLFFSVPMIVCRFVLRFLVLRVGFMVTCVVLCRVSFCSSGRSVGFDVTDRHTRKQLKQQTRSEVRIEPLFQTVVLVDLLGKNFRVVSYFMVVGLSERMRRHNLSGLCGSGVVRWNRLKVSRFMSDS